MLNSNNSYIKIFSNSEELPKEEILLIYKSYLQLIKHKESEESLKKADDIQCWRYICQYFISRNEGKIGLTISEDFTKLDLSPENIFKVYRMLGSFIPKITPNYYTKICGTTGLFIFILNDILTYAGILSDKKSNPQRMLALSEYACTYFKNLIEK